MNGVVRSGKDLELIRRVVDVAQKSIGKNRAQNLSRLGKV